MVRKKKSSQEVVQETESPLAFEEATPDNKLRKNLEEIKNSEGVIGYILRNSTSAAIDLKDPSKIIDYAVLSSSALEASEELSELFNLGEPYNIVVEGEDVKVLTFTVDENRISIFAEKDIDFGRILKKFR